MFTKRLQRASRILDDLIQFTSIGVMKNALGEIKSDPRANLRNGKYIQRHDAYGVMSGVGVVPTSSAYQSILPHPVIAGAVMPSTTGISISKGTPDSLPDLGLLDRHTALLHESGHMEDPKIPFLQRQAKKVQTAMIDRKIAPMALGQSKSQRFNKAILESERTANQNAISRLGRSGSDIGEISDYKRKVKSVYHQGYKLPKINEVIAGQGLLPSGGAGARWSISDVKGLYEKFPHLRTHAFEALWQRIRFL